KAQELGYLPEVILAGRRINDGMGKWVAGEIVKLMIKKGATILGSKVLQLGITFKENCPDIRNSHAVDVVRGLEEFGCAVDVYDPWAEPEEIAKEYGLNSVRDAARLAKDYDAVVLAVAHREFAGFPVRAHGKATAVVYDIKGVLPRDVIDARL
ncbi:MAG: hypothetical protein J6333_05850, partial [Planctomycetes bacterium]|nr:hypothetical protein [Planctomycetota bacterium]